MNPEVAAALDAIRAGAAPAELESATLEFKAQGRSAKDVEVLLAEAAACLANAAAGGSLVVGVRDGDAGPAAFEGCTISPQTLQRRIFELTDPPLVLTIEAFPVDGARLLVVTVPSSADVHQVQGRATERIGASCRPMTASRIAQVVGERRGDDWSAGESRVHPGDVSPRAMEDARRLLSQVPDPRRQSFARESTPDLLRRLALVTPAGTLNLAGELLLVGQAAPAGQIAYVFRRPRSGELVVNERLSGPMLPAVIRVLELVEARVDRTPVNFPGGQQQQLADLPDAAVREAVINAVMHREYRQSGAIHVEHTPTRLAVTSPGPFVSGVTPANVLTTAPRARNPVLANAIRTLGLAEAAGVGIDRMYAEMARVGHQPPEFEADLDRVRVTLLGGAPNAHVARFVATLPSDYREDPDTMLVLLRLLKQRTLTAAQMAPVLQRPEAETAGVLEQLSAEPVEMIERTRESTRKSLGVYRLREHAITALGPAVAYRRRSQDESDRKIIGLVRETNEINGRMVRLLLDVTTLAASRLLADLVDRQILVKTSRAQRGPGVTYGPGPTFPNRRARPAAARPSGGGGDP